LRSLEHDDQLKKAKALAADGGLTDVKYHALDITDSKSIVSFAEYLKNTHGDGVDFVINNAGIAMDGFGETSLLSFMSDVPYLSISC
jgi:carbonyl reductase 1